MPPNGTSGPSADASLAQVETLTDPVIRKRARHVVGDNARVRAMADAFAADDLVLAAQILSEGHRSYAEDFEASTPTIEAMIDQLTAQPGVLAARLTGGGFGGSIVVFAEPGHRRRSVDVVEPGHAQRRRPNRLAVTLPEDPPAMFRRQPKLGK